jgi:hypothetical protein
LEKNVITAIENIIGEATAKNNLYRENTPLKRWIGEDDPMKRVDAKTWHTGFVTMNQVDGMRMAIGMTLGKAGVQAVRIANELAKVPREGRVNDAIKTLYDIGTKLVAIGKLEIEQGDLVEYQITQLATILAERREPA